MGCCTSSTSTEPGTPAEQVTIKSTTAGEKPGEKSTTAGEKPGKKPVSASKADNAATVTANTQPAKAVADPASIAAPAPGVKHVRAAYKGKGWAPPQKEWESTEQTKGDKTRIEIEDEWDDDGNLRRTTTKHITTPDWKKKTETTVEIFSADEAEKMGLGRK
mmetsp:Transcript_34248/g.80697  ORF Transcript_34248/g.80697 Transcript_34248/m.80697 type:complete len:162 (+) Transcript_34248:125-610(+)